MENQSRFLNALEAHRIPELDQRGYAFVAESSLVVGDDAMVACVEDPTGEQYAIRVALEFGTGLFWERHYRGLAEGLPHSVATYFPKRIHPIPGGITLVGRKMPAILMEWIPGPTLHSAVARAATAGNWAVLNAIASALRDLSIGLRDSRVTHGDLTTDNLMFRHSGELVCVDLDTIEWPGARKRVHDVKNHAFRHPLRSGTPAHQDAYAILRMFVSTMLLRDQPDLAREAWLQLPGIDRDFLYDTDDLRNPDQSEEIANVRSMVGERGRDLLNLLISATNSEAFRSQSLLDQAFDIADLSTTEPSVQPVEPVMEFAAPEVEPDEGLDVGAIVQNLRELYGDHRAVPLKHRGDYASTWPEPQGARIESEALPPVWQSDDNPQGQATRVVRRPIERLTRRPTRDMSKVLEDEARAASDVDRQVADLSRSRSDLEIIALADRAAAQNLILEERTRHTIRLARQRCDVRKRLERALETNDRRELADLAVSGELGLLGDTTRESLVQVLQALEWPGLLRALETDDDTLILTWFDEEVFENQRHMPAAMRRRIELARIRTAWLEDVRGGLASRDAEILEPLVANEPENGRARLSESERRRVREIIDRKRALHELERSIRAGNTPRVVSALAAVESTGAQIDDPVMWDALQQILERAELLKATLEAARQSPPDDRALASLLPRIREHGLSHDPTLRGDFSVEKLQSYILRGAAARRIRRGIDQDDDRAIRLAAFPDTTGAMELLTPEEVERVMEARATKRVKRIDV